jgi:hypothetical protein
LRISAAKTPFSARPAGSCLAGKEIIEVVGGRNFQPKPLLPKHKNPEFQRFLSPYK